MTEVQKIDNSIEKLKEILKSELGTLHREHIVNALRELELTRCWEQDREERSSR